MTISKRNQLIIAIASLLLLGAILLTSGAYLIFKNLNKQAAPTIITADNISFKADSENKYGVPSSTEFTLEVKNADIDIIKSNFSTQPGFEYDITKLSNQKYKIKPLYELKEDITYHFSYKTEKETKTFSYYIRNPFAIKSIFPDDSAKSVPFDTSIEIEFTAKPSRDIEKYIDISPKIDYNIQVDDTKLIIVPISPHLSAADRYTVTIKPGLKDDTGQFELLEGKRFTYTINNNSRNLVTLEDIANFNESDLFFTSVYINKSNSVGDISANIYFLNDENEYLNILHNSFNKDDHYYIREISLQDTSKLTLAYSFKPEIYQSPKTTQTYLMFPEKLKKGWYLVEYGITINDVIIKKQQLIQVSDIAELITFEHDKVSFWINSVLTKKTVTNAVVELYSNPNNKTPDISAKTDHNGIAKFSSIPKSQNDDYTYYYKIKGENDLPYVNTISFWDNGYYKYQNTKYLTSIYLDKPIYHQTDTVEFWGVAIPTRMNEEALKKVKIAIMNDHSAVICQTTVNVNSDGSFIGKLPIENLKQDSYQIAIFFENEQELIRQNTIFFKYVEINDYVLPVYKCDIEFDKEFYKWDDNVNILSSVNYYDETPASNFKMSLNLDGNDVSVIQADERGKNISTIPPDSPHLIKSTDWRPSSHCVEFKPAELVNSYDSFTEYFYVFHKDTMITTESKGNGNTSSLQINANKIDLSKLNTISKLNSSGNNYSIIKGDATSVTADIKITKHEEVISSTNTYYDPIYKRSYTYNSYSTVKSTYKELKNVKINGEYTLTDLPYSDSKCRYYVEINTQDSKGRSITEYTNLRWKEAIDNSYYYYHGLYDFKIINQNNENNTSFSVGDPINVKLINSESGDEYEFGNGYLLLGQYHQLETKYNIVNSSNYSFNATEDDIPGFTLFGAYFDGSHIFEIKNTYTLRYNIIDKGLDISISTDKEQYKPGDTPNISVLITDKNKKPVPNATVCVGISDEKLYNEDNIFTHTEFLNELFYLPYRSVTLRSTNTYANYLNSFDGGGGGGGGGNGNGNIYIRENFKDTTGLTTATTNNEGTASFTIKIPDGITSWKVNALAVSSERCVGKSEKTISSTLPFFINPIYNDKYIEGENISILLRSTGSAVSPKDSVQYIIDLKNNANSKLIESKTITTKTATNELFNFGKLPNGEYEVLIKAKCGNYSDAESHTIQVVQSVIELPAIKDIPLTEFKTIKPVRYPVELIIYDKELKPFMIAANYLMGFYINRNDVNIAKTVAKNNIVSRMKDDTPDYIKKYKFLPKTSQNSSGGITVFNYSQEDIVVTAKAVMLKNSEIDMEKATAFLEKSLKNPILTKKEFAAINMAFAVIGKTDASSIIKLLNSDSYPLEAKLYLLAGITNAKNATQKDLNTAKEQYNKIIKPLLRVENLKMYVASADQMTSQKLTAIAILSAFKLSPNDVPQMIDYICSRKSTFETSDTFLELAFYLEMYQPKESDLHSISYEKNGKRIKKQISGTNLTMISLTQEEFDTLLYETNGGPLYASVSFTSTPENAGLSQSNTISLTKEVHDLPEKKLGARTTISLNINLNTNAPEGAYIVKERIPSNLRFVSLKTLQLSDKTYCSAYAIVDDQDITIYINKNKYASECTINFEYTVAYVLGGETIFNSSYLYHDQTMSGVKTPKVVQKPF